MTEKDDDKGIDWSQATDEQLKAAAAESKTRRPLTDWEGIDWNSMSPNEFQRKSRNLFDVQEKFQADQALEQKHADMVAEKDAIDRRKKKDQASADA